DFIADVVGLDGDGRQNHQHARAIVQSSFDRTVPSHAWLDVQLVYPNGCAGSLEVFGQAKGEVGIVAAIAEESCGRVSGHGRSPGAGRSWNRHPGGLALQSIRYGCRHCATSSL